MYLVGVISMALVACGGGATPAQLASDRDESLAGRVTARILQLAPNAKIERRGPNRLHVWANGEHDLYLDNLEQACGHAAASCDERIDTFARTVVNPPDGPARLEAVLPTLKSQAFVDGAQRALGQRGQNEALLAFPVIDDLRMLLVMDTAAATRFLTDRDLAQLAVTREVAAEGALANLRQHSPSFKVSEVAPELFGLAANDAYDSAMFLLHPEWRTLIDRIDGAPVVVPIGRDIVLFTSEKSQAGLQTLAQILAVERREPAAAYPITTQPYRWTPGGWARYELSAHNAAGQK